MARDKKEAFVRVVERRMTKILYDIKRLGNLASNNYVYEKTDVDAIVDAISDEVKFLGDKLYGHLAPKRSVASERSEQKWQLRVPQNEEFRDEE